MSRGVASNQVEALRSEAQELLPVVRAQARRGYVVEISGTPKAGKSSTIRMLETFFRATGWRVSVLQETAGLCPLPMKGHFFFNTWTTAMMLAGLLEAVDEARDLIIVDRGLFDALVWLEQQRVRGQVAPEEATVFSDFVLLERWRKLVDLSIVMRVSPQIAMEREQHNRLVPRQGTVMNEVALEQFNDTLLRCQVQNARHFQFETLDTDSLDRKEAATLIAHTILRRIRGWVDPTIAGVSRVEMERLIASRSSNCVAWDVWDSLKDHVTLRRRSDAEADPDWVQLMACGVVRFEGGVFVFDRGDREKALRYGKTTIWRSCHVEGSQDVDVRDAAVIGEVLRQRLADALYIRVGFAPPTPIGIVWDPNTEPQHAAIVFDIPIETRSVADSLVEKEFRTNGRRHSLLSRFVATGDLSGLRDLESWSQAIIAAGWLR